MIEREAAIDLLFVHRAADALFNCACGWMGDGFGDPWRAHVLDALLSARDESGELLVVGLIGEQIAGVGARIVDASGPAAYPPGSMPWDRVPPPARIIEREAP